MVIRSVQFVLALLVFFQGVSCSNSGLQVIRNPAYSEEGKLDIAKRHLVTQRF